jgi:hypothetical protein
MDTRTQTRKRKVFNPVHPLVRIEISLSYPTVDGKAKFPTITGPDSAQAKKAGQHHYQVSGRGVTQLRMLPREANCGDYLSSRSPFFKKIDES